MWCFNCDSEIDVTSTTVACPVCGTNIALDVNNQLAAEDFVLHELSSADRDMIEDLVLLENGVEAMRIVRRIRGKREPLVENRVLRIIEQSRFNSKMITCQHCKSEIDNPRRNGRIGRFCPICHKDIAISEESYMTAEECINDIIAPSDRYKIEKLLSENKQLEAMHFVREIRGQRSPFVELAALKLIAQNPTTGQSIGCWGTERTGILASDRITQCQACNHPISKKAETCPHCGHPTGVHVCPKCQSINTTVISGASKATSVFLWGPFAANRVVSKFQCKDCGHKW